MITKPEIRKDYIQDKYVIIAPKRSKRPHDVERPVMANTNRKLSNVFTPEALKNEKALSLIGTENQWQIKVIQNKFPAVSPSFPKAYGHQEVVIETPDPVPELEELPLTQIAKLFDIYAERTTEITKDKKIEYILIFKNNGGHAGQSLQHSHSQIFATKFLPPHLLDKSQKTQEYKIRTGTCVYCDVIKKEKNSPRKIFANKHIVAIAPYASMFNYESWILPVRHIDNITQLTAQEKKDWAMVLKNILKKIGKLQLPYNFYFHQVIHDEDQHLYMKIVPRGSVWAGVEVGSGIVINPIEPEEAAKYFRK